MPAPPGRIARCAAPWLLRCAFPLQDSPSGLREQEVMYSDRSSPIQSEAYEQDMVPVLFAPWAASLVAQAACNPANGS